MNIGNFPYGSPAHFRVKRGYDYKQKSWDSLEDYYERRESREYHSWPYDDDWMRDAVNNQLHIVNEDKLLTQFVDWHGIQSMTRLKDLTTGEVVEFQAPKRGNHAFARKKRRQFQAINKGLDGMEWYSQIEGRGIMFRTHLIFLTLTYKRGDLPLDKQTSWQYCTKEVAKFRYKLSRLLRCGIASITVKEGTRDGYPAPHIMVVLNTPVTVKRHVNGEGMVTYRLQNGKLLGRLRGFWSHGFIDVQGVASGSKPIEYVSKYMTKGFSQSAIERYKEGGAAGLSKNELVFLKTHAWQKVFRLRAVHVSVHFKNLLNRLDSTVHQSQHGVWAYDGSEYLSLSEFYQRMQEKYNSVVPPKGEGVRN